jgi:DNA-binding CsgD family transcriptional regulator
MLYWSQRMMDLAAKQMSRRDRFTDPEGNPIEAHHLTDRERDVLSWAARGKTQSETSIILGVAEATVETHIKHAMLKLGAGNKTHAVARALFLGLIDI